MVTAILVSSAELDPAQTFLLKALQRRAIISSQRRVASRLIQYTVRQMLLRRARQKEANFKAQGCTVKRDSNARHSSSDTHAKRRSSTTLSVASTMIGHRRGSLLTAYQSRVELVGNLVRLRAAQRKFKSQKIMLERYTDTQVANLKVLQGELTKLATAQATFRDQMTSQMTSLREELLAAIGGGMSGRSGELVEDSVQSFSHKKKPSMMVLEDDCHAGSRKKSCTFCSSTPRRPRAGSTGILELGSGSARCMGRARAESNEPPSDRHGPHSDRAGGDVKREGGNAWKTERVSLEESEGSKTSKAAASSGTSRGSPIPTISAAEDVKPEGSDHGDGSSNGEGGSPAGGRSKQVPA